MPLNSSDQYCIIGVDKYSEIMPLYTVETIDKERPQKKICYCLNWRKVVEDDEVLKHGQILTDDNIYGSSEDRSALGTSWIRIRTILYEGRIFYHKMKDGEVADWRELT